MGGGDIGTIESNGVSADGKKGLVFGKEKLLEQGARANGVVVEGGFNPARGWRDHYKVKVRVEFEDGSTTEITRTLHARQVGDRRAGSIVPVRYDPSDRSNIEIDEPAMKATSEANRARLKELDIANAQRRLRGEDRAGADGPAHDSSNPSPDASGGDPSEQRLAKLQRMRDKGLLTPEEYSVQRQRILDSL